MDTTFYVDHSSMSEKKNMHTHTQRYSISHMPHISQASEQIKVGTTWRHRGIVKQTHRGFAFMVCQPGCHCPSSPFISLNEQHHNGDGRGSAQPCGHVLWG